MDSLPIKVLVIEDNEDDYHLLLRSLSKENIAADAKMVFTSDDLASSLKEKRWDIVISDNNLPDKRVNVRTSLELSRKAIPDIPFIIVSGTIGEENAVNLMKLGANDYILKDNLGRLGPAVKREITDATIRRKKLEAERKLLQSEERYKILAESIKDMFFAVDRDLTCTFWNTAAEATTKISAADAVGRHLFEILPPANESPLREKLFESIGNLTSDTIEIQYDYSHHIRYYQVTIYPSNEVHSIIVKDISESKKIMRQLKTVNEELETFIYRISHDLRGPLASMQGLINLAKNGQLPLSESDFFGRIKKMTGRLEDVIRSFQDVARIKQEAVDLKDITILQLLEEARTNANKNFYEFRIEMDEPDGKLTTDPKFLIIALEKIIDNAIEYRHPARRPMIVARFSKINEDQYEILLKDNGVGIPENLHDKIFKMFFRGNVHSSGSGLGLYLAMSAVGRIGGTIEIRSTVDHGSSFSIRLPADANKVKKLRNQREPENTYTLR